MNRGPEGRLTRALAVVMSGFASGSLAWAQEPRAGAGEPGTMTVVSTEAGRFDMGAGEPLRLSMEFQDANLKDVLKAFSAQTGINVIASQEVGERTITLYLEDVTAMDALDQILQASSLTYERPAGSQIYIVRALEKKPTITTITRVYPLKFARVSTSKLAQAVAQLSSSASSIALAVSSSGSSASGESAGSLGGASRAGTTSQTGGASEGAGVGIDVVIGKLLTKEGKVVVDERTNRLIVTDIPENFAQIEAVIAALDIRTSQVLVEAEILETTLSKIKDLGIEWGTGSEGTLFQFTPAQRMTQFPYVFVHERKQTFLSPTTGVTSAKRPGEIVLGTLDSSQMLAALQALEQDSDTKILARPKVLTLDNETALIRLTSNQAVGFTTTRGESTGTTTSTPERTTTGVSLAVTPQVNDDGFVTMVVQPEVTKVVSATVSPPSGQGSVVDPKTRSAQAVVRVRSGDTLVLAGLIDHSDQATLRQVPILADLPLIGGAFKNTEINDSASELIVFVSPRILTEPPATRVAAAGSAFFAVREQETSGSRQHLMEEALKRLEPTR